MHAMCLDGIELDILVLLRQLAACIVDGTAESKHVTCL